jgi:activating signal cointegrator complex subunit 3
VQGWWEGGNDSESRPFPQPPPRMNSYIKLHADQDYVLRLKPEGNNHVGNAHAPRFPRSKDIGWFLVLGIGDQNELLALKRVPANARTLNLAFKTPNKTGRAILTLYVMSNCYLGIDQQFDLHIEVIESSIEAQYNTEVV